MMKHLHALFREVFIKSWWFFLFVFVCQLCYMRGIEKWNVDFNKLHAQYLGLQKDKKKAYALQENLLLQVNSQSDPDWIELTLMKGLGLVPEGQIKVVFTEEKENNLE